MKSKRSHLLLLFVLLMIVSANKINVHAMNTGFSTEELPEEMKKRYVSAALTCLNTEPEKISFVCFDVNEQGLVAIGQEENEDKKICVYSSQGEFLYGYKFNASGAFYVEWDGQIINLYKVRSGLIMSIDPDGNILDVKSVQNTYENSIYNLKMLGSTKRIVGNTTYVIRNDMGILNRIASSYSQIVTIDAAGTESIIYDVNSMQFAKTIVAVSVILIVVAFVAIYLVRLTIKQRREYFRQVN